MTEFDKAVKRVKTCLFWDFADGQWLDTLYTPLDRGYFNRLMQNVIDAHESEDAKLREELEQWRRLTAGIELPEYPITEFKPKDLERENAKLRELVRVMAYCNQYRRDCDGCRMNGAAGIITERVGCDELLARLHELGLEMDA